MIKKLIATVVTTAALVLVQQGPPKFSEKSAWETACKMHPQPGACVGLVPPQVSVRELPDGWRGRYKGWPDPVEISNKIKNRKDRYIVMVHEMVHYIDHMKYGLQIPGPAVAICESEERAWRIVDRLLERPPSKWWKQYPWCERFYQ